MTVKYFFIVIVLLLFTFSITSNAMETNLVHCPKCGNEINVGDVLAKQVEAKYREKEQALTQQENSLKQQSADIQRQIEEQVNTQMAAKEAALAQQEKILQQKTANLQQQVEEKVNAQIAVTKETLKQNYDKEITVLKEANNTFEKQLQDLQKANSGKLITISIIALLVVFFVAVVQRLLENKRKQELQETFAAKNTENVLLVQKYQMEAEKLSQENQLREEEMKREKENLQHIKKKFEEEQEKQKEQNEIDLKRQKEELKNERKQIEEEQEKQKEQAKKELREAIKAEKDKFETEQRQKMKQEIEEEKSEQIKVLQELVQQKSDEVKELHKTKAEIERLKTEKNELADKLQADMQTQLNEILKMEREKMKQQTEEREKQDKERLEKEKNDMQEYLEKEKQKIQKNSEDEYALKIREKELKLEQLSELLEKQKNINEDMKRKAEQNSQELQGEALELVVEEFLRRTFPLDNVSAVNKGAYGADIHQRVISRSGNEVGVMVYECKRTQNFDESWIGKLNDDMLRVDTIDNSTPKIPVIITVTMPKDNKEIHQRKGVWICSYNDFKGLTLLLRESLLSISEVRTSQENKGEKMHALYDYFMSSEFRALIGQVVQGFRDIKKGYEKEQSDMHRHWSAREKQLNNLLQNTFRFTGALNGIAQIEIPQLDQEQDVVKVLSYAKE
ncbi:MAG: DUF2130 domain-containing protein [Planctomycetaceae bacterium]|nr:DUF2130 domain-containing protein [Planctomycetaceae bacterium]